MMVVDGGDSPAAAKLELFLSIGLDKRTAENALVNHKVTSNLVAVIKEVYLKHFHQVFSIKRSEEHTSEHQSSSIIAFCGWWV